MLLAQNVKANCCWALLIFSLGMIAFDVFMLCNKVDR
jgi:hypothetical protein